MPLSKPARLPCELETRSSRPMRPRPAKFANVTSVTSQGEATQIYYIGFLGQLSERKQEPVFAVYESQASITEYEKIQGTEGNSSLPSR
ncbi:hypothetical protein EDB92DRAFT_1847620 [Lactarius akahatsu]|uniref:Uncharacterized protein n=1 Tax=Lactarius akahatsu TaxID=416441 RepID=A0AAD4QF71_9AGAM|nr:hypothetical protein EDB92DRAFT_1847620 [Lactarius akahatsu]